MTVITATTSSGDDLVFLTVTIFSDICDLFVNLFLLYKLSECNVCSAIYNNNIDLSTALYIIYA